MPRQRIVNVNVVQRLSSVGVFRDEAHISAQTVIPQHTTTPEYPEGFPTPPPEYKLMFKSWANAWWKDHPGQPAPNWLCDLLDKFTSLLAPPSKVEVDAAHSRLVTAESRVSAIELRLACLDRLINHSYQQSLEGTGINNNEIIAEADRKIKETWVTYDRAKIDLNEARQSARLVKAGFQEAQTEFRKAKSTYDAETARIFTKCEIDDRLGITSNTDSTYKPTLRINGALWTSEGSTPSLSRTELPYDYLDIDVDLRVQRRVRVFQAEIVHHPTRRLPSHLKFMDTSHIGHGVDLRYLPSEHGIVGYFCADIVPVVREILKVSRPGAELLTIVGNPTNQADMFFQVRAKNAAGQWVYSSVPVEFKRPYSYDKKPAAGLTQSPEWAMEAEMPTPEFGQRVVMQLYGYMSEGSYGAPSVVVGTINPRFGFFSTYNDTWFMVLGVTS